MSRKRKDKKYDYKIATGDTGEILIGIPRERVSFNQFLDNRDSILAYMNDVQRGGRYYQSEGHRVDRNRDDIGEYFLNHSRKPEWLWMIDSDMDHPVETGVRLTRHNKPIIGALYFHRGKTHDPFVFEYAGKAKDKYGRMTHRWKPMRDEVFEFLEMHRVPMRDGSLIINDPLVDPIWEVDAVATGSMVIHRSVLESMPQPWFEYRDFGSSEDLMFCYEAKKHGVPVFADVSTICGHFNWTPMGQAQFRTMYLARGINNTNYTEKQAITWVSEFLGLSEEAARDKVKSGNAHMVGDYWNSKFKDREPSDEEISAFYEEDYVGDLYLIELLHWNFSPTFHQIRQMVMPLRNQKVIEIGGGIGTVGLQLAIQKNNVLSIEPNEKLRKFIEMRHAQHMKYSATELGEFHVMGLDWVNSTADDYFDAAVSFDTFEHIPVDELQEVLHQLNRVLRPGGSLYYHANFKQQDLYPMHLDHSDIWNNMLMIAGFAPQTEYLAVKVK